MKLKGVNFFEQHVEKLVLGTVSVVFLGVVAMQFLYEPNKIKVGNASYSPGSAFEPVEKKAQEIKAKINASADDLNLPPVPKVALVDQFKTKHNGPVAPSPTIVAFGRDLKIEGTENKGVTPKGTTLVNALAVPAPTSTAAVPFRTTFDPVETLSYPELKKLLPAEQPFDKAAVSVETHFDGTALKAALLGESGADKSVPMPVLWWREQMESLGVKLERQEQIAGGQWGKEQEVPPIPGHGVPDLLKNVKSPSDLQDAVSIARTPTATEEIQRPEFYHTIAGVAWKPPADMAKGAGAAQNPEVKKLLDARKRDLDDQDRQKKALDAAEKSATSSNRNVPPPTTGGGGAGKGGSGGGGGGIQAPTKDPVEGLEKTRKPYLDKLKRLEDSLAKNEEALKALGVDTKGNPLPAAPAVPGAANAAAPAKGLLDNADVHLWGHDLTAEPGKTYRYRVKVVVTNPAFGRNGALVAEQQDLAKTPVIESAPSAWTDPVNVLADKYFFITSATEGDSQSPARATAELYQFFYGYYRKSQPLYLEPGDVLTAEVKLPEKEKLPIYDLTGLAANPDQPAGTQPAAAPSIPPALRGGKGGQGVTEIAGRG